MAKERFEMRLSNKEQWESYALELGKSLAEVVQDALSEHFENHQTPRTRWTEIECGLMFLVEELDTIEEKRALTEDEQKYKAIANELYSIIEEKRRDIPR